MASLNDLFLAWLKRQTTVAEGGSKPNTITATHTADNTVSSTSETILAANANRRAVLIQNTDDDGVARINLTGATATATNGFQLKPAAYLYLNGDNCPVGIITAIREASTDTVLHVVEFT